MRPHRRSLFPVNGPGAVECDGYICTPPSPPVPSSPYHGPAPSPAPASSPIPACPPIHFPPSPSPSAHRGRRNQGGGMHGHGPPPPPSGVGGGGDDHRWHYVRYVLIAVGVIAFVSLILLGVSVAVRRRQVRRRRQALLAPAAPPPGAGEADDGWNDPEGGGGGGGVVHHVWYIRTVGLDEAAINSIAATRYRAGAGLLGAADCSVCLGEFRDGELVRLLPKCGHAFHVPCIDTWLRAHVNCPLCRSDVIDPAVTAATGDGGGGGEASSDTPTDQDANDNVEAEQAAAASDAIPDHEQEDRESDHQEEEASPAVEDQQERSSSPDPPPPQQQPFCPLPRNVRRAASMDAAIVSTAAEVAARERLPEAAPEEEQIGGRRKRSCAKASGSGHRSNLSIDRPASGGIPRSFFSRHSRARSSVLPLSSPS
ncbi:hypothetical protein SEVIR_7G126300v4 [Setaria viridis]|uniref:RING-type E3 ubiquitin transferase n=1 Tax=Setaria viridis TaxID=4556 RepID=A0A4U6U3J6_SETVI|nr:E3 ubiquitin-protein ligase Os04g0590900-like [Setaria viridis]TKW04697.1 hypothetical protein SEVIR_7G126300v2 [Setaria viridis]